MFPIRRLIELDSTLTSNKLRAVVPPQSYSRSADLAEKSLAGVTIAVKDMLDIEGSRTTLCNRACTEYQSPKDETAPCIKRLQDFGAWVVGKTRLNAMVVWEETMECVEFLAPYNPRAMATRRLQVVVVGAAPPLELTGGSTSQSDQTVCRPFFILTSKTINLWPDD